MQPRGWVVVVFAVVFVGMVLRLQSCLEDLVLFWGLGSWVLDILGYLFLVSLLVSSGFLALGPAGGLLKYFFPVGSLVYLL